MPLHNHLVGLKDAIFQYCGQRRQINNYQVLSSLENLSNFQHVTAEIGYLALDLDE